MIGKKSVVLYTDGACSGNPGPGGWGAVFVDNFGTVIETIYGSDKETTNNKMELTAVIEALKFLNDKKFCSEVQIFTDSQYVKNGITIWIKKWKVNNWRTANNEHVKNQELWKELDLFSSKFLILWNWVKAHGNDVHNNMADLLAKKGTDEAIK